MATLMARAVQTMVGLPAAGQWVSTGWSMPSLIRGFSGVQPSINAGLGFSKILIANRGEIACRVMKTARKMGIRSVAVYSEADANAQHVKMADEAVCIGPPSAAESYLVMEKIIDACKVTGSEGVHPGYGFLSENAIFAEALSSAGIKFIGPPPYALREMGSKSASKRIMDEAGVPVVPGYHGDEQSEDQLIKEADRIGYPLMIKAVMGGGGKGMRIVQLKDEFERGLSACRSEAMNAFGDDRVIMERFLPTSRHIEFQVFCDSHGNAVHLNERGMTSEKRAEMGTSAVAAARAVGYEGAGTVEFIVDPLADKYYFMEMNTRLQVEHPVTELTSGVDLVEWQLRIAAGETLPLTQDQIPLMGHALEARVYAEDPHNNFLPDVGRLVHLRTPEESDTVRVDTGVVQGDDVSVFYDPLIAKLITAGENREQALRRMAWALDEYQIGGLRANIDFLRRAVTHPAFVKGQVTTSFIDEHWEDVIPTLQPAQPKVVALAMLATILREQQETLDAAQSSADAFAPWARLHNYRLNHARVARHATFIDPAAEDSGGGEIAVSIVAAEDPALGYDMVVNDIPLAQVKGTLDVEHGVEENQEGRSIQLTATIGGTTHKATVVEHDGHDMTIFGQDGVVYLKRKQEDYGLDGDMGEGSLHSPMPGKILKVLQDVGVAVTKGMPLLIMEAMKMEQEIKAPHDGVIEAFNFGVGEQVDKDAVLVTFVEEDFESTGAPDA